MLVPGKGVFKVSFNICFQRLFTIPWNFHCGIIGYYFLHRRYIKQKQKEKLLYQSPKSCLNISEAIESYICFTTNLAVL